MTIGSTCCAYYLKQKQFYNICLHGKLNMNGRLAQNSLHNKENNNIFSELQDTPAVYQPVILCIVYTANMRMQNTLLLKSQRYSPVLVHKILKVSYRMTRLLTLSTQHNSYMKYMIRCYIAMLMPLTTISEYVQTI